MNRFKLFNRREWVYGFAGDMLRPARKNLKHGNVQFILWEKGEHGHKTDFWHDFDRSWFKTFTYFK